jgi:hypothetical protein
LRAEHLTDTCKLIDVSVFAWKCDEGGS